jgi:hypothetical protein
MTVYKSGTGSVYSSWCEGGPAGAVYAANKSGYFDMEKFIQWFKEVGTLPIQLITVYRTYLNSVADPKIACLSGTSTGTYVG